MSINWEALLADAKTPDDKLKMLEAIFAEAQEQIKNPDLSPEERETLLEILNMEKEQ